MFGILLNSLRNPKLLKPTLRLNDINELSSKHLQGIKCIVFDKDDTLTALGQYKVMEKLQLRADRLSKEYSCCVVSNDPRPTNIQRIGAFPYLKTQLRKPHNFDEIYSFLRNSTCDPTLNTSQIAIVGDRLLTDIYLGNSNNCRSIYVKPLQQTTVKKHGLTVYLLRKLEDRLLTFF